MLFTACIPYCVRPKHSRAGGHFCRIKLVFRNGVGVRCAALAVLFNRQTTKKGQQVDAQGCRLKLCGFVPLIKAAWRAAFSPTVHATVLRKCGHVPFTMKAAYEQLALETKQDAERDGFRRDGAEDLTGDVGKAAPGQCDCCGIKNRYYPVWRRDTVCEDCRRQSAQPKQSAVVTAVRELLAVEFLNGQVKAALVD